MLREQGGGYQDKYSVASRSNSDRMKSNPEHFNTLIYQSEHCNICLANLEKPSGVNVEGMWNAHVEGQVTETHGLRVNNHCDAALFISVYDITMEQP